MKKCERCGHNFKFLQYTYYTTPSNKTIILCDNCRKIVEKSNGEIETDIKKVNVKNGDFESLGVSNGLNIPDIGGFWVALLGIFFLLIALLVSLIPPPEGISGLLDWFNIQRIIAVMNAIGLLLTLSGIIWMIYSIYDNWKDAINKIYKKLK